MIVVVIVSLAIGLILGGAIGFVCGNIRTHRYGMMGGYGFGQPWGMMQPNQVYTTSSGNGKTWGMMRINGAVGVPAGTTTPQNY